jgi:hypothetical protein
MLAKIAPEAITSKFFFMTLYLIVGSAKASSLLFLHKLGSADFTLTYQFTRGKAIRVIEHFSISLKKRLSGSFLAKNVRAR